MTDDSIRLPPQNLDAERGALGSLMLMPHRFDEIAAIASASDFYADANRIMFSAIGDMHNRGCRAIDAVTLFDELKRIGKLEEVGGAAYIATILENVPHAEHGLYYARIVREKSQLRNLIYLCADTMRQAYDYSLEDPGELITELDTSLIHLRDSGASSELATLSDAVDELEAYERNPVAAGRTGLIDLDRMLDGGLREAQSIIVAGRPGHGKSVVVCQIARTYAERGEPALIISLEMLNREIAGRFARTISRDTLRGLPVYFDDAAVVARKIVARIRNAHRQYKIKIAVLDYIQLVEPDEKKMNRERQVAEVSRSMKLLARELKIPVVVACQLNRQSANEKRPPRLSDLRESGSIEQDADIVLMLHEDDQGDAQLIVAKQRGGRCGSIPVVFDKAKSVFRDSSLYDAEDYSFTSDRKHKT